MIMNALSDQIRYLNPPDHHPARITKAEKYFTKRLDFKDIKFPVKPRDSHKIEKKKNSIGISVFGNGNKVKYQIYLSKKCCEDKNVDLLFTGEEEKKHYALIKDFNTLMYDHTLPRGRKYF